jgi:altronate dehydratase small subunit
MAQPIEAGADALVMDGRDDVATALRDLQSNEEISYRAGSELVVIRVMHDIPFGHKLAITSMITGHEVRKYGEVIGRATTSISPGEHVHVHNVEGIRGRGDQKTKGEE